MSHDLDWYKNYAEEKGYELTNKAERVIQMVDKCEGFCPCRFAIWKKTKTPEEMEAILARRRSLWQPKAPKYPSGVLKIFSQHAVSPYFIRKIKSYPQEIYYF